MTPAVVGLPVGKNVGGSMNREPSTSTAVTAPPVELRTQSFVMSDPGATLSRRRPSGVRSTCLYTKLQFTPPSPPQSPAPYCVTWSHSLSHEHQLPACSAKYTKLGHAALQTALV